MLLSLAYANRNYRAAASREDESVPDSHESAGGSAERAESGARGHRACAGREGGEALRGVQAEENHLRDHRVRGYRRLAEGSREKFRVAGAAARGGCAGACGALVRESG